MRDRTIEFFEDAFNDGTAGCRRLCACGKEYYDAYNSGYDWEDGEFDTLEEGDAIPIDHSIGDISFEGKTYAMPCDCWHDRARKILSFINGHSYQIAAYLNAEKKRKFEEAQYTPSVD